MPDVSITPKPNLKGYKVADENRGRKYGVAADSLKSLREKSITKFNVPEDYQLYLAKDGFLVTDEEFFQTIVPQTLFVLAPPDVIVKTEYDIYYEKIRIRKPELYDTDTADIYIRENAEEITELIKDYEKTIPNYDDKIPFCSRDEDPEWFQRFDKIYVHKELVMTQRARELITRLFREIQDSITKYKLYRTNLKAKKMIDRIIEIFRYLLRNCNYFGMLYDRTYEKRYINLLNDKNENLLNKKYCETIKSYINEKELLKVLTVSFCNDKGEFLCQADGIKNMICSKNHKINPYSCEQSSIIFHAWIFDHRIDLYQSVIPSLIENVEMFITTEQKCPLHDKNCIDINSIEYFLEMFSYKNMRLVYLGCYEHVKGLIIKSNGGLICEDCKEYAIIKNFPSFLIIPN